MLKNFQLAAIVGKSDAGRLLRIPLHQRLQSSLAQTWKEQCDLFLNDVHEIEFNAGYQPEEHERFVIEGYEPPVWLEIESSQSVPDLDPISDDEDVLDSMTGIAAFARNESEEEVVLFQNFNRSHVIRPGRFLFLHKDTYEATERPGLTLDRKLSAVYQPKHRKLLFSSFRIVNTFLPLADFYEEASDQEIRQVLSNPLLAPVDADALVAGANQWFRKRFAMLRESGVLNEYTARQIKARSRGFDVEIHLEKGRIVFPAEKTAAKKLLQFLNEELFRGAITDTLFETNSKREAD